MDTHGKCGAFIFFFSSLHEKVNEPEQKRTDNKETQETYSSTQTESVRPPRTEDSNTKALVATTK